MGKSGCSHARKSDKETQSPMLKIFKEIMQRENDPEKTNLVREKRRNKKRKLPTPFQSKTEATKSIDSSGTEGRRRHRFSMHTRKKVYSQHTANTPSCCTKPLQSEKRDSWLFWGEQNKQREQEHIDDTCSCVSCALKRLLANDYTCVACLLTIFAISAVAVFCMLYKAIPIAAEGPEKPECKPKCPPPPMKCDSTFLKQKLEQLNSKSPHDYGGRKDRSVWDNTFSEFTDNRDSGYFLDREGNTPNDLRNILDPRMFYNMEPNSEKLKEFYKKLLATDAQIKKLKQGVVDYKQMNRLHFNNQERQKRSLFHSKAPNITGDKAKVNVTNNGPTIDKPKHKKRRDIPDIRLYNNLSDLPTGLIYEKKKIVVQYLPETKKFPKCSHTPKDSKSHESDLKHPFYKNTQRLDELLDKFLEKKLPDFTSSHETSKKEHDLITKVMLADTTSGPVIPVKNKLTPTKSRVKSFYEATEQMYKQYLKPKVAKAKNKLRNDLLKLIKPESKTDVEYTTSRRDYLASHYVPRNYFRDSYRTTSNYDFVLSISTLMNQSGKKQKLASSNMLSKFPSRRLLQTDGEEEETLGYEDLKEVLSDEVNKDVMEKEADRKRRDMRLMMAHQQFVKLTDASEFPVTAATHSNKNPPGVHNPNWKGPMPLYPDELNAMIKNAAMQNIDTTNQQALPVSKDLPDSNPSHTDNLNFIKDNVGENDLIESDSFNDVQYIEDYLSNKYDKLVKMAQAYSDYGVLDGKKDNLRNEKEADKDKRVKLEAGKPKSKLFFSKGLIESAKKRIPNIRKCTSDQDGFKVQIKSQNGQGRDFKLSDHIKLSNNDPHEFYSYTPLLPLNSDLDLLNMPTTTQGHLQNPESTRKEYNSDSEPFSLGKLKRSLKSVKEDFYFDDEIVESNAPVTYKPILNEEIDDQAKRDKRSIKSIDIDDIENNETVNLEVNATVLPIAFINNKSDIANVTTANATDSILTAKLNESMSINETAIATSNMIADSAASFFFMLTDFFSTLAGFPDNSSYNDPNTRAIKLLSQYSDDKNETTTEKSKEMYYPMYDSDMVDNIGHRSRVLMSLQEETNSSDKGETQTIKDVKATENPGNHLETVTNSTQSFTNVTTLLNPNNTAKEESGSIKKKTNLNKEDSNKENKTVVKRSIEDSSLIFWNDIYDDEYGVQVDPLDKTVREKMSTGNDKLKMSRQWIQDKMKKMTDTVKKKSKDGMNKVYAFGSKKRISRDAKDYGIAESGLSKIFKKNNKEGRDERTAFAIMTAHMKQVCKDAAQAVYKTRSLEVREDSKEDAASTGLMAELIRMMSELVDYQVQLKTCVKLPPDLKEFLVWLTAPAQPVSYMNQQQQYPSHEDDNTGAKEELKPQTVTFPSMTREEDHDSVDTRSECLGTLRAVEDLIREYDLMTEEDKSKMTGIKEYLEAQLDFLNKQLYESEESVASLYNAPVPFRFRRDVSSKKGKPNFRYRGRRHSQRGRIKGALGKYIKSFSKKRTKTTASNYDGQISTEAVKKESVIDDNAKLKEDMGDDAMKTVKSTTIIGKNNEKSGTELEGATNIKDGDGSKGSGKEMKRNLQDVYYRALEEAKKYTTVKKLDSDGDNQ